MDITIPNFAYEAYDPTGGNGGFNGFFFYPNSGSRAFASISASDSAPLYGLGFNIGTGFFSSLKSSGGTDSEDVAFQMIRGGVVTSEGTFAVAPGTLLGFGDPSGFDQLLIGAYDNAASAAGALLDNSAGEVNAVAIDNLEAQLGQGAPIPEPSTIALLGFGLMTAVRARRARSPRQ